MTKRNLDPKSHCMIVHAYYPLGETRVEREALALVDRGYAVDVICLRDQNELEEEWVGGIHVYRLSVQRRKSGGLSGQLLEYLRFFWLVVFKLMQLFPRRRYATIQAHNPPDFLIFSALIPKLAGARLILDIHDIMPEFLASKTGRRMDSLPVRLAILQEKMSCHFADYVITVTEVWHKRLIQRGVRADKVGVVMNLADDRIFKPIPSGQRAARQAEQPFRLIYHGTFKKWYGLDILIRAIGLVRPQIPAIQLTLQGVGDFYDTMAALVKELDLQDNVRINNNILATAQLPGLICQADVGVVPNLDDLFTGDLLPTKLLEYVALDVPVIAARTRAISSYFDESMLRFFTPGDPRSLADCILETYHSRDQLAEQVGQMKRFTAQYNWNKVSGQYFTMLERLSQAGSQPSLQELG